MLALLKKRIERDLLTVVAEFAARHIVDRPILNVRQSLLYGRKTNSAPGSTNFLMSQGHEIRSTLTLSRVIHFMLSLGDRNALLLTSRQTCRVSPTEFRDSNLSKHLVDSLLSNVRAETLRLQSKFEVLIDP
jgi:hypothetical protein